MHRGGDRDAEYAAADDQHVWTRLGDHADVAAEHGALLVRELVAPDRAGHGHSPILGDRAAVQGTNRRRGCCC